MPDKVDQHQCASEKPGSVGEAGQTTDSDQHSGKNSWDKRGHKADELASAAEDMNPDELRRLRRRISNRESARRLRKQRNEKLHTLVAQEDSLQAENEALAISIAAAKTVLQRLHADNTSMRAQLGEDVKLPEAAAPKSLHTSETEAIASKAGSLTPDQGSMQLLQLSFSQAPDTAAADGSFLAPPAALRPGVGGCVARDASRSDVGTPAADGASSPPSNVTADTSAAVPDKAQERTVGACTDMPPPPPPALPLGRPAPSRSRLRYGVSDSLPAKQAKLAHTEAASLPAFTLAVSPAMQG